MLNGFSQILTWMLRTKPMLVRSKKFIVEFYVIRVCCLNLSYEYDVFTCCTFVTGLLYCALIVVFYYITIVSYFLFSLFLSLCPFGCCFEYVTTYISLGNLTHTPCVSIVVAIAFCVVTHSLPRGWKCWDLGRLFGPGPCISFSLEGLCFLFVICTCFLWTLSVFNFPGA